MPGGGGGTGGASPRSRNFAAARAVDRGRRGGGGPARQTRPVAGGPGSFLQRLREFVRRTGERFQRAGEAATARVAQARNRAGRAAQ